MIDINEEIKKKNSYIKNDEDAVNEDIALISSYIAAKRCRQVLNISLMIILVALFAMHVPNSAPFFAIIIYNIVHIKLKRMPISTEKECTLKTSLKDSYIINAHEIYAGQISLVIGLLLLLLMQFAYATTFDIIGKNILVGLIPTFCIIAVLVVRYPGTLVIRQIIKRTLHNNKE